MNMTALIVCAFAGVCMLGAWADGLVDKHPLILIVIPLCIYFIYAEGNKK